MPNRFTNLILIVIAYLLCFFVLMDLVSIRQEQKLQELHVFCIEHRFSEAMILDGKGYCKTMFFSVFDGNGGDMVASEEYLREFDRQQNTVPGSGL